MPMFGSNGQSANNSNRINWWNDGSTQIKGKNIIYDGDSTATFSDNMMWTKKGAVTASGNVFHGPDGAYTFSGGILHGPNGETWTGVNSKKDALSIIAHRLK